VRAGILEVRDLPPAVAAHFGEPGSEWIGRMIGSVVHHSVRVGTVAMEAETLEVMNELRAFMFERVYLSGEGEHQRSAAIRVIRDLVEYHLEHPDEIPPSYRDPEADLITQVVDFVSGATDRYAITLHDHLFRPRLFESD
jgi:dGTPase